MAILFSTVRTSYLGVKGHFSQKLDANNNDLGRVGKENPGPVLFREMHKLYLHTAFLFHTLLLKTIFWVDILLLAVLI